MIRATHSWAPASALACVLALAACAPDIRFAPPPQKTLPQGVERPIVHPSIDMSDLRSEGFIIQDVLTLDGPSEFAWTNHRPRFQVWLDDGASRVFRMRIGVPEETFTSTGPVTVSVLVNGQRIAAPRFDQPGMHDYECPVAEALLAEHSPAIVGLDIQPVFLDPRTHKELGVLLYLIGLPQAHIP